MRANSQRAWCFLTSFTWRSKSLSWSPWHTYLFPRSKQRRNPPTLPLLLKRLYILAKKAKMNKKEEALYRSLYNVCLCIYFKILAFHYFYHYIFIFIFIFLAWVQKKEAGIPLFHYFYFIYLFKNIVLILQIKGLHT